MEERVDDAYNAILAEMQPADGADPEQQDPSHGADPEEADITINRLPANIPEEAYNEHYEMALADLQHRQKALRLITRAWQRFSVCLCG